MDAKENRGPVLRFGVFELQPAALELRRAGAQIRISEQPLKLLALLCERSGEIVSRDDIRQALWGGHTFVDFERNINFCVNQLRSALGDDAQNPRFIETVPRRGYRFLPPVERRAEPSLISQTQPDCVAVVSFANISGDSEAAWLGWAIAETVTADLQKLTRLRVLGRDQVVSAVARLGLAETSAQDIPRLAKGLQATWLVWGAYQKVGQRIRLTAHFTRAASGELAGSAKVDGLLEDIFQLEDEVVENLLQTLSITLSESERTKIERPETTSLKAYEYYVKGRQEFNRFGPKSLQIAKMFFEKAAAAHPEYALANCGLGSIYTFRYITSTDSRDLEIGIGYLQRAAADDPELVDAHVWLSYAYTRAERYEEALQAAQHAADLNPRAHMAWYQKGAAYFCRAALEHRSELFADALREFQTGMAKDPGYPWPYLHAGWIYMVHGMYEAAEEYFRGAVCVQSSEAALKAGARLHGARTLLGILRLRQGRLREAREEHQQSLQELAGCDHMYRDLMRALSYAGLGDVAFREANYVDALTHYRTAKQIGMEHPTTLGLGHILSQLHLRQASCLFLVGRNGESLQARNRAGEILGRTAPFNFGFLWEAWDAQDYYELAVFSAITGDYENVSQFLEKAVACGWRDRRLLLADPVFTCLHGTHAFEQILRLLREQPGFPVAATETLTAWAESPQA
ncbi:MAG: winged helix-turn-helix domain-containing protein [Acidobacteriaceae bacterium]|nr:winged helix-turn-helix domain-containing protein [Acidobacteriaceae bacterium]